MHSEPDQESWSADDAADFGRVIFERVPPPERPDWAAAIVLHSEQHAPRAELNRLVELGLDPKRWLEAEPLFHELRQRTLENERAGKRKSVDQLVLDIAETAAKVIANAGGAKFDHHAGWRLAPRLKALSEAVADNAFERECWNLLVRRRAV